MWLVLFLHKTLKNFGKDLIGLIEFLIGAVATFKAGKVILKNTKEAFDGFKKTIDDIFDKRRDEFDGVGDKKGKYFVKSFLDSDALTAEELLEWEIKIKIASKNKCRFKVATKNKKVLNFMDKEKALAFFDGNEIPPIIWYKEGATKYVISHEYYHLEEFMKIGKKEFLKGVFGNSKEWHVNNILREKYAYERVLENASEFTQIELNHANWYYTNEVLKPALSKGVEMIAEYVVKFKK